MTVYARVPIDATPADYLTMGKGYRIVSENDRGFSTHDDNGCELSCFWTASESLGGADWERIEVDECDAPSDPASHSAPCFPDIVHDLLKLHIAHHNHPVHVRARDALAEIAEPVE